MLLYANDLQVGDMVLKYDRRRDTRMGDKMKPAYTGPYITPGPIDFGTQVSMERS